jgi:hypothetical protein
MDPVGADGIRNMLPILWRWGWSGVLSRHDREAELAVFRDNNLVLRDLYHEVHPNTLVRHLPLPRVPTLQAIWAEDDNLHLGLKPQAIYEEILKVGPEILVGIIALISLSNELRDEVGQWLAPMLAIIPTNNADIQRGQLVIGECGFRHFGCGLRTKVRQDSYWQQLQVMET